MCGYSSYFFWLVYSSAQSDAIMKHIQETRCNYPTAELYLDNKAFRIRTLFIQLSYNNQGKTKQEKGKEIQKGHEKDFKTRKRGKR